jgi:hypothetical protein
VVDLVEALARLIKQGRSDLAGLMVGHGKTYEACREAARRHGLADRILPPGHVAANEVERLYSVRDVLAYPRRSAVADHHHLGVIEQRRAIGTHEGCQVRNLLLDVAAVGP